MDYLKVLIFTIIFCLISASQAMTLEEAGGKVGDKRIIPEFPESKLMTPKEYKETTDTKGVILIPGKRFYSATGVDFDPRKSGFDGGYANYAARTCTSSSTEQFIDHEIKLLNGDILSYIDVWGRDSNVNENLSLFLYKSCSPYLSAGALDVDFFHGNEMSTSTGDFIFSTKPNKGFSNIESTCKIMARIRFGDYDPVNYCDGATDIRLYRLRSEIREVDFIFESSLDEY